MNLWSACVSFSSHTAITIGHIWKHAWLHRRQIECQRESTVTSQPTMCSVTKQATCEPRAVSSPPTKFIPELSLPEWTSTTRRWNNSLLAFQRKVKHGSKNKMEQKRWEALWSSSDTACSTEKQTARTVCTPIPPAWAKSNASTLHWLVL